MTLQVPGSTPPHSSLPEPFIRILEARHHNPFEVLGKHRDGQRELVRAFLPRSDKVRIVDTGAPLTRIEGTDLFE